MNYQNAKNVSLVQKVRIVMLLILGASLFIMYFAKRQMELLSGSMDVAFVTGFYSFFEDLFFLSTFIVCVSLLYWMVFISFKLGRKIVHVLG